MSTNLEARLDWRRTASISADPSADGEFCLTVEFESPVSPEWWAQFLIVAERVALHMSSDIWKDVQQTGPEYEATGVKVKGLSKSTMFQFQIKPFLEKCVREANQSFRSEVTASGFPVVEKDPKIRTEAAEQMQRFLRQVT